MPSENPAQRQRDIVDNIDAIREFSAKMDGCDFAADRKKARHPGIDWAATAAAGNVYRHEYEGVDTALIWHTVRHSLVDLRTAAAVELERLASA